MHLPKRAVQNAGKTTRPVALRASAAVSVALLLVWLLGPPAVLAMSRSSRPHTRSVAQEQEPSPSRAHGRKHASKSTTKGRVSSSRTEKKTAHKPAEQARAKSKSKHHSHEEQVDDPVEMKRAHGGRKSKASAQREVADAKPSKSRHEVPTRGRHSSERHEEVASTSHSKESGRPETHHAAAKTEVAEAATAEKAPTRKLTTDDFIRAIKGSPTTKGSTTTAYAQGESHPDEMDETQPTDTAAQSVVVVKPAPARRTVAANAQVSASPAAAKPEPAVLSEASRVDGFGAEGAAAPKHRTLARTMAKHHNDPLVKDSPAPEPAPVPTAEETAVITDEVVKPQVMPALYTRGGRLIMPAPLKGSHEILVHQNEMADAAGLERLRNDDDLDDAIATHKLVRLPETESLHVNDDLPVHRRYARPWTVRFAVETAKAYESRFGVGLQVNSAVRTISYQLRLQHTNGNAASVEGDTASPHLTGQAIDFGKRGMSKAQLAWMRAYLLPLMQAGKIDVEEEFQQACFHVSVYRSYYSAPKHRAPQMETAAVRRAARAQADDSADDQ